MEKLSCSFCGKDQSDVLMLIRAPRASVCNECVQLFVELISTAKPEWLEQHREFLTTLPLELKPYEE